MAMDNQPYSNEEKSDEELKREFEDAFKQIHSEEMPPEEDPFSTDALGNEPAEEDDSGSV
jgi:hypothetical protein